MKLQDCYEYQRVAHELPSMAEYLDMRARHAANQAWAKQYEQKSGVIVIPLGAQVPPGADITNDERSAIERYEFVQEKPEKYFLYVHRPETLRLPPGMISGGGSCIATTWTGERLGRAVLGKPFHGNFGDIRYPIWIDAINGEQYQGVFYASAGDYARVRKVKGKSKKR